MPDRPNASAVPADDAFAPRVLRRRDRGYLPHIDGGDLLQFVTFRLADSIPLERLKELRAQGAGLVRSEQQAERRRQLETWLDEGMGSCALANASVACIVRETLRRFDGERYALHAWCIMPTHVHVLIRSHESLGRIVQSWKSYTARWVTNRRQELGLEWHGSRFWMRDYWDRYIRSREHYERTLDYIHQNPVKAGLCLRPEDWPWSSATSG